MQLQITTDYAIRIIGYMALNDSSLMNAREMAGQIGITYQYFQKIITRLRQAGLIESEQGRYGGYRLAKDVKDITLYDIVETMQGAICIIRCLEPDGYCSRHAAQSCTMRKIFELAQNEMIATLKGKRINEIWNIEEWNMLP